ncbi:MAG: ABC transporter permease [Acidobacteria bacterium]|nr:ABC transporter permease [Acidobacteriota bacterium]
MQELLESFKMAIATLRSHKLRASLTVLGVVIGVMTVMVVASLIAGIQVQFDQAIDTFGTRTLFVFKEEPGIHFGRQSAEVRQRPPLTFEDVEAIGRTCAAVEVAVPFIFPAVPLSVVRYQDQQVSGPDVRGTTPSYERFSSVRVSQGRFFSEGENSHRQTVCVIGSNIADKLFPNINPLGKELTINGAPFTIIGITQKQENMMMGDEGGENNMVYVPYETMLKMYPQIEEHLLFAQAAPNQIDEAKDQITELLRRRRAVPYDKPNNFSISTPDSLKQQFDQLTGAVVILMFAISSVGLLVGGIGVMNIMLVSVTERTREIGVRKAIGAKRRNITWQFLTEAMVLTAVGGVVGILVGWGISRLVQLLIPTYTPAWAPIAGLVVSISVGLFFGLWPAMKAARLDPVEALRYE